MTQEDLETKYPSATFGSLNVKRDYGWVPGYDGEVRDLSKLL